ncbi:MAG: hypothetical protein AVDCRST_MAG15-1107, partial [uncultured Rubellimicrobium sp.]
AHHSRADPARPVPPDGRGGPPPVRDLRLLLGRPPVALGGGGLRAERHGLCAGAVAGDVRGRHGLDRHGHRHRPGTTPPTDGACRRDRLARGRGSRGAHPRAPGLPPRPCGPGPARRHDLRPALRGGPPRLGALPARHARRAPRGAAGAVRGAVHDRPAALGAGLRPGAAAPRALPGGHGRGGASPLPRLARLAARCPRPLGGDQVRPGFPRLPAGDVGRPRNPARRAGRRGPFRRRNRRDHPGAPLRRRGARHGRCGPVLRPLRRRRGRRHALRGPPDRAPAPPSPDRDGGRALRVLLGAAALPRGHGVALAPDPARGLRRGPDLPAGHRLSPGPPGRASRRGRLPHRRAARRGRRAHHRDLRPGRLGAGLRDSVAPGRRRDPPRHGDDPAPRRPSAEEARPRLL